MSTEEDLKKLIDKIEAYVPYVAATIGTGNTFKADRPDWVEVHAGRARSSYQQLQSLIQMAKEMRNKLEVK